MTPYLLVLAVLLGLAPALIAHGKGRNFFLWWVYGVVLGPIALLHAILLRRHAAPSPFAASQPRARRWRSRWPAVLWAATSVAIAIVVVTAYGVLAPEEFGMTKPGTQGAAPDSRTAEAAPETKTAEKASPPLTQTTPAKPAPTVRVTLRQEPAQEKKPEPESKGEKLEHAPTMPVERMIAGDSAAPKSTLERTTPKEPAKAAAAKTEQSAKPEASKPEQTRVAAAEPAAPAEASPSGIPAPPPAPKVAAVTPGVEPKAAQHSKDEPAAIAPKPAPSDVVAIGETVQSVQLALAKRGYDPGPANGRAGRKTQTAIRKFQKDRNLTPTGAIDYDLLEALGIVGPRVHAFRPPPGMTVGR